MLSAADGRFSRCLHQFLLSGERQRTAGRHRFIVFDLGLGAERERLAKRFAWCEFRAVDLERFAPHMWRPLRQNGWKPPLIEEVLERDGGLLLWLDSATILKAPLEPIAREIRRRGVYSLRGQATLAERCDAAVLDALHVPLETRRSAERVGGVVGLDGDAPAVRRLVRRWSELVRMPQYLGTRSPTHLAEQALLGILLHEMQDRGEIRLGDEEVDISSASPVAWLSTRNLVSPTVPRWADPLVRLYYTTYKALDQRSWRLRRWYARRVLGLHRWPKEHFSVFVGSTASGRVQQIRAPRLTYYADPFVWTRDGVRALFFEEFDYLEHNARLRCVTLDASLAPSEPRTVFERRGHASFPFIFEHDGALHMVPETSQERCVDLYRCEEFPHRWRCVRNLLDGVNAADSVVFAHDGSWWLITSLRDGDDAPRYLGVFWTTDLLGGHWRAHPINQRRLYGDQPFGYGRNAGAPLRWHGALLRPVQTNARYYGEGMLWMRITALTPEDFREEPFESELPLARLSSTLSPHHLSTHGDLVAWDVRDRLGYWQNVPLARRFIGTPLSALAGASARLATTGFGRDLAEELRCSG